MSDKKIITVGAYPSTPLSAQTVESAGKCPTGKCPTAKTISNTYRSSKAERRSKREIKRVEHPMHGALSRIIRVPDGQGGTKSMKMKTAIKKGFVKLK